MAFGWSAATWAMIGVGTSVAAQVLAPSPQAMPAPQAPPPLPQASQGSSVQGVVNSLQGQGQAGGAPGIASTMLTGSGGVDPSTLALNKSTLTGGTKTMLG